MRRTRTGTCLLVVAMAAGTTAVTASGAEARGGGGGGGGGGAAGETVRVLDRCDAATFNAAIGEGTCVGNGDTTFDEFLEELLEEGEVGHWRFNPDDTHIDHGEHLKAVNLGGEVHTFTEVQEFGGGCVDPVLNAGQAPVDECGNGPGPSQVFLGTLVFPGQTLRVPAAQLTAGHDHLFMCLIHPWMRTVVDVRADD